MLTRRMRPRRGYKALLLPIIATCVIMGSCKKESQVTQENVPPPAAQNDYLAFSSMESFNRCMQDITAEGSENALGIVERHLGKNARFLSLSVSQKPVKLHQASLLRGGPIDNDPENPGDPGDGGGSADVLVPDPYFATVLNENHEVQIGGTVYKVTEYGTFMCTPEKLSRVYSLIEMLDSTSGMENARGGPIDHPTPDDPPVDPPPSSSPIRFVEPGIYRYSNVISSIPHDPVIPDPGPPEGPGTTYVGDGSITPLPQSIYDGFPTFDFNAKTWAGQLIQSLFGRTKAHHSYFDNEHRVKVNFYNVDYGFYAAVGMTVKMQTKGWTGFWRKLHTDELRLGWDGVIIDFKIPNANQPQVPQMNFGNVKLGDFNFPVHSISLAATKITKDEINNALNGALESQFKVALKKIWDYVFQTLAPGQANTYTNYVKAFKVVYPDKVKIVFGRFEQVARNTNSISKNFDWNVGFSLKWNPDGSANNLEDFIPTGAAYNYDIKSASIYGCARYYGVWKGARIEKK